MPTVKTFVKRCRANTDTTVPVLRNMSWDDLSPLSKSAIQLAIAADLIEKLVEQRDHLIQREVQLSKALKTWSKRQPVPEKDERKKLSNATLEKVIDEVVEDLDLKDFK